MADVASQTALVPNAECLVRLSERLLETQSNTGGVYDVDSIMEDEASFTSVGLPREDFQLVHHLYKSVHRIVEEGAKRRVRIIIDAEHT